MTHRAGPLVIIGGHEDKEGERRILKEVARHVQGAKLVVATVASHEPEGYFDAYRAGFEGLGVGELVELYVDTRADAQDEATLAILDDARGVFFSGGDQLRISSQIGDTPVERRIREIWRSGGVVAGTSAGASAVSDTMLVKGPSAESHRVGDVQMAPGMGLLRDVVVDQHFAERGRIGRLLGVVAESPRVLGIGVDEDTAAVIQGDAFTVIGSGAVYVVDAEGATHSNIAEAQPHSTLSIFDVRLHVLSQGDRFDLTRRRPLADPAPGAAET